MSKLTCLDKLGWPIETIKGRPALNFLRRLIHTRRIARNWKPIKQQPSSENQSAPEQQEDGDER